MPGPKIILVGDPVSPTSLIWLVADPMNPDCFVQQSAGPSVLQSRLLRADFWGMIEKFLIDYMDAQRIVLERQGVFVEIERISGSGGDRINWRMNGRDMAKDYNSPPNTVPAEFVGVQLTGLMSGGGVPARIMEIVLG